MQSLTRLAAAQPAFNQQSVNNNDDITEQCDFKDGTTAEVIFYLGWSSPGLLRLRILDMVLGLSKGLGAFLTFNCLQELTFDADVAGLRKITGRVPPPPNLRVLNGSYYAFSAFEAPTADNAVLRHIQELCLLPTTLRADDQAFALQEGAMLFVASVVRFRDPLALLSLGCMCYPDGNGCMSVHLDMGMEAARERGIQTPYLYKLGPLLADPDHAPCEVRFSKGVFLVPSLRNHSREMLPTSTHAIVANLTAMTMFVSGVSDVERDLMDECVTARELTSLTLYSTEEKTRPMSLRCKLPELTRLLFLVAPSERGMKHVYPELRFPHASSLMDLCLNHYQLDTPGAHQLVAACPRLANLVVGMFSDTGALKAVIIRLQETLLSVRETFHPSLARVDDELDGWLKDPKRNKHLRYIKAGNLVSRADDAPPFFGDGTVSQCATNHRRAVTTIGICTILAICRTMYQDAVPRCQCMRKSQAVAYANRVLNLLRGTDGL